MPCPTGTSTYGTRRLFWLLMFGTAQIFAVSGFLRAVPTVEKRGFIETVAIVDRLAAAFGEPAGEQRLARPRGAGEHRGAEGPGLGPAQRLDGLDALAGKSAKQLRRLREDRFLALGDPGKGRRGKG